MIVDRLLMMQLTVGTRRTFTTTATVRSVIAESGRVMKDFDLANVSSLSIFRWENTPPDSPRQIDIQAINPEADVYAISSQDGETASNPTAAVNNPFSSLENRYVYFIAIIDPLTNYGFKKQVIH